MKQKAKALYHSKDHDGLCCGAILQHVGYEAIGYNYGEPIPADLDSIKIMADVSLPTEYMAKWGGLWIDHHLPAIDAARDAGFPTDRLVDRHGWGSCYDCYKHLVGANVPEAVTLLAKYDVWDLHLLDAPEPLWFQLGWRLLGGMYLNDYWNMLHTCDVSAITERGRVIASYQQVQAERILKIAPLGQLAGHDCLFIAGEVNPFYGILIEPETIVCCYWWEGTKWVHSLRASELTVLDLGQWCRDRFGGGGHKLAAGFSYNKPVFT